ncbi:MAG: type I DNA topoisomerase [Deltaproteobacteria bacterium]|nr:type I DNA topoisomerase [Deltaproteobacteria bacterium]
MANSLVIVESPAKAKTIEKFLGKGYQVLASYGHVRDLPSKDGSVDVDNDFLPKYVVSTKAKKQLSVLKQALKKADNLVLATDPDREGEAIAWHLLEALGVDEKGDSPRVSRVVFHEITKDAVNEAMANPRQISTEMVDAQQARRILDYLVGFNLSPVLWRKIPGSRSAGRVQSVALRLICEREAEIEAFKAQAYWTIEATMANAEKATFSAKLHSIDGQKVASNAKQLESSTHQLIADQKAAEALVTEIKPLPVQVSAVTRTEKKRRPAAPFTTSTLQQEANRKLGFSARKTMSLAQKLYEGIDTGDGPVGLITYMRTDSVTLSNVAIEEARKVIADRFGKEYVPAKPRTYKSKAKNAQEAHEAIRPSGLARHPETLKSFLDSDELRLYKLIWERTIAAQMADALLDATTIDILAGNKYQFRASGQVVRFPGFMKVYIEGKDTENEEIEGLLPSLNEKEALTFDDLHGEEHTTQPPPRFTEASLVKILEENGIGRPSTYAATMNTLVERKYVLLTKRTFFPQDLGREVIRFLMQCFDKYVDYKFTANMEDDLDAISLGKGDWKTFLRNFWVPFKEEVDVVKEVRFVGEPLDEKCPECQETLSKKFGRNGYFIACNGYPECKYTRPVNGKKNDEPVYSDEICEKCGAKMLFKEGRYGKYLACSGYPDCKNNQPLIKPKSLGIDCPSCKKGEIMEKKSRYGKIFYSCNRYPKCKYALWDQPFAEPCPKCAFPIVVEKTTKRNGTVRKCPQEECDYQITLIEPEKKPETKKAAAKKAPAKKPAAKKAPAKKTAAKKPAAKKTTTKKT